jgi:hypothetical protein
MKKRISIALLVVALAISLPAGLSAQEEKERTLKLPDKRLGLIVNFTGLASGMIDDFNDGFQTGLGMKFWFREKSALRGLIDFSRASDTDTTTFGLGAAYEYHLTQARVSPYLGGLAGLNIDSTAGTTDTVFYFGPMLGAEFQLVEGVSLFGEYVLTARFADPDFFIDLGLGNNSAVGIIVYLN